LLEVWRSSLSKATRDAYAKDLGNFAVAVGAPGPRQAVEQLLAGGKIEGEKTVLRYLQQLAEVRKLSPATVARRRAALRSVVRMANGLGLIEWVLTAPMPKSARPRAYRDTRGPGLAVVRRMRDVAAAQRGIKSLRDVALVGLLYSTGLRRSEACNLDIESYRSEGQKLAVIGKGHTDAELVTVPPQVAAELETYLAARGGSTSGPLFVSLHHGAKADSRLTPSGLYQLIRWLARRAGVEAPLGPHKLRHASITHALDGTGGDVRRVRHFSRHSKFETVLAYDDARSDHAGQISVMLASAMGAPRQADGDQEEEQVDAAGDLSSMGISVCNVEGK